MSDELSDIFSQYEFLNASENNILQPESLRNYFSKLQKLEMKQEGQVHALHIGDSHIQADFFSGKVRDLYAEDIRFPMNARGFAFPYKIAKTNNPHNYGVSYTGSWEGKRCVKGNLSSRWGLAGVTACTFSANSTFIINPNKKPNQQYKIQRIKVFYPTFDERSFEATVDLEDGNSLTSTIMGDGYVEFNLLKAQDNITIALKKTNEKQNQFVLQGISMENDESGLIYSASGVNGAEVPSYFRCEDFKKNLAHLNPQLIVVSLGTNDAFRTNFVASRFKADFVKLIADIRSVNPNISILLTSVGDSYRKRKYVNRDNAEANKVIREIGIEQKVAVWDFYQVMGGFKSMDNWKANGLSSVDKLHLSQKGYELQGELLYRALDRAYSEFGGN
ncbi:MAG: lysophospholipase L1-like esterase [Flammeovirgaceae bacterium]|jgi:lysophospholipase L1-like esterase